MSLKYPEQTQQHLDALKTLRRLLDESSVRLRSIDSAISHTELWPEIIAVEFSYLQIRMLCETVALACLVAHGDITATEGDRFQKAYAADEIITRLERLHGNFYPHPVITTITPASLHIERVPSGFVTKAELVNLYRKCGERLHRGSLRKLHSTAPSAHKRDILNLEEWRRKFQGLLSAQHIASLDNLSHYICFLSHPQSNGNALVVHALSPLPDCQS